MQAFVCLGEEEWGETISTASVAEASIHSTGHFPMPIPSPGLLLGQLPPFYLPG